MGDIAGDLSAKRGQLTGTDSLAPGTLVIKGQVPLSELNNYQARLKSVTAGQGSYAIEFARYDPVPPNVSSLEKRSRTVCTGASLRAAQTVVSRPGLPR